ncbi:MAG: hypothetical protein WAL26_01615 [Mycobacterium sp.]
MPRAAKGFGWDPFGSRDRFAALWSAATVMPSMASGMASGAAVARRTMFLTIRRLVVGRSLTVQLSGSDLCLTVTDFNSELEVQGLALGQFGDVLITAGDVSWGRYRFDTAAATLRNVHFRPSTTSLMVTAPVELVLKLPADVVTELLRNAAPWLIAEIGADETVRLRWSRRPEWGYVEADLRVAGTALWLKPRAAVVGRRRWTLANRLPVFPIGLPDLPHDLVVTKVALDLDSVLVEGLLPQWRVEMPLGRIEELIYQLNSKTGVLNLSRTARRR